MYSTDREKQLEYTISCLRDMQLYPQCQKTLVVDGKMSGVRPNDWQIIEVPRFDDKFCWGRMWDAGVTSANNEIVLYLDSDRMWPKNFLEEIIKNIEHDKFLFTSQHFLILDHNMDVELCKEFLRKAPEDETIMMSDKFFGKLQYDPRWEKPLHGPGKNVMSGGTAFTKNTYYRVGPVDPWYCGHGAFADTDYHQQAARSNCKFHDLKIPELHCHHERLERNEPLNILEYRKKGLDNFIYYVKKWALPISLAQDLAYKLGVFKAKQYVAERLEALEGTSPRNLFEEEAFVIE